MSTEVQTSYSQYQPAAQAGTVAAGDPEVDSKICDESNGIDAGLAVSQGTSDDRGVTLGGTAFVGISLVDVTQLNDSSPDSFALGDNMPVGVEGDFWVVATDGCTAGEEVLYDTTTGVLGHNGGTVIDGARWMTTASATKLAVCRLSNASGNASGVTA